nr:tandem-95 repeat protein [Mesobacterium pallidum]
MAVPLPAGLFLFGDVVDDTLTGSTAADRLEGLGGNDLLIGQGGNDTLLGGLGQDTLTIGGGRVTADGQGGGTTTYRVTGGFDSIDLAADYSGEVNVLELPGVASTDVTIGYGISSRLSIAETGGAGRIILGSGAVSEVRFSDVTLTLADLYLAADATGRTGLDLFASSGTVSLDGGAGDDYLSGRSGSQVLQGFGGADSLSGSSGDDTLDGGAGHDTLNGGSGNDTYLFSTGFGHDLLYLDGGSDAFDVIVFDASVTPGDIGVTQGPGGYELSTDGGANTLTLSGDRGQIAEIRFADGTVWTPATLAALAVPAGLDQTGTQVADTLAGGAGNDEIAGGFGDDLLSGGDGNDYIYGGAGLDTITGGAGDDYLEDDTGGAVYTFGAGFGQDYIWNLRDPGSTSAVAFDATILPADVIVEELGEGGSWALRIAGTGDMITFDQYTSSSGDAYGLDEVRFADGTTWDAAELAARLVSVPWQTSIYGDNPPMPEGGAGDDIITGNSDANLLVGNGGNDTLDAGSGDDTLDGGAGDDSLAGGNGQNSYLFSAGFGQDTLYDYGYDSEIVFDATLAPADIRVEQAGSDLILHVIGTEDRITILYGATYSDLEQVVFDDGTTWTKAEMIAAVVAGTGVVVASSEAADTITGTPGADSLDGMGGGDSIDGLAGDDTLVGGTGADTVTGGTGDDLLTDEGGDDTYLYALGDGSDRIEDAGGIDRLAFGPGIAPADVTVTQIGGTDILLRIGTDTQDRITIAGAWDDPARAIETVAFDDGTSWSHADLVALALSGSAGPEVQIGSALADTVDGLGGDDRIEGRAGDDSLLGGSGSDTLSGGDGADTLVGGTGGDTLDGGAGDDVYRFGLGEGSDTITDGGGLDRVEMAAGLLPGSLAVTALNGTDIVLRVTGSEDRLVLAGALDDVAREIEEIRFADGTSWSHADLLARIPAETDKTVAGTTGDDSLAPGAGDDTVDALDGADLVDGGAGHDLLEGGLGNDTVTGGQGNDALTDAGGDDLYHFARGDGQDRLTDLSGLDAIQLGAGIAPADLWVVQDPAGTGLILRFAGTEDRIHLAGALADSALAIEELRFDGGAVLTFAELVALSQQPTEGSETITGTASDDALYGAGGDDSLDSGGGDSALYGEGGSDTLTGRDGNDTLDGGAGTDSLMGGLGDDAYVFGLGSGQDTITDTGGLDRVEFGAGVEAAQITVRKTGTGVELRLADGPDRLTIADFPNGAGTIETLLFADGSSWDAAELLRRATAGTAGDDSYAGSAGDDVLVGLAGDDTLDGLAGNDLLDGGADDDVLSGGAGADTLDGGAGEDTASGGTGGDLYVFAAGDGILLIDDQGDGTDDTLRIEGYALDALRFAKTGTDGADLTIRFAGSTDRIVVTGAFAGTAGAIETLLLADSLATLTLAEIEARVQPDIGIDGSALYGDETANTLTGTALGDYLSGGAGADTLTGGDGDDIFGDIAADDAVDQMTGGAGRDTYRYLPSFDIAADVAEDVITDFTPGDAGDVIRLSASTPNPFATGRLQIVQDGADTTLMLTGDDGTARSILRLSGVDAGLLTPANFGGVSLTRDSSGLSDSDDPTEAGGGPLGDLVYGNGGADTINGYGGNDTLAGGADGDQVNGGFGDDSVAGEAGHDALTGGAGNDILSGGAGDDTLTGGDEDAEFAGNDIFDGGLGDDLLQGGAENDIYVLGANDGRDTITDAGGTDRIAFDASVAPGDVTVVQIGDELELRVAGGTTRVRLAGAVIEEIAFDGGTTWDWAEVLTRAMGATEGDDALAILAGQSLDGLGGNDTLTGSDLADTITGGTGDDVLRGGLGDDVYRFAAGFGQDAIDDRDGLNVIELGAGIAPADVALVRGQKTVILEVLGTGDRIDLGWDADPAMAIREVRFDGGTVWTAATLVGMALAATAGDDVIHGTDGAETLTGGAGDDRLIGDDGADDLTGGTGVDLLEGGLGDDTYRFALGDDQDRIADGGGSDVLVLGPGITEADIRVAQSSDGSAMILAIGADGDRIRIDDMLGAGRIETIRFDSGTEWGMADLLARVPTALDDHIFGDETDNPLTGGLGDDRISGGAGDDTYTFAAGDGRDIIRDGASSGADRLVISGYALSEIRFAQLGTDSTDLAIQFDGSDDQILIAGGLDTRGRGIETVEIADDGVSLTIADITARLVAAQASDGADTVLGSDSDDTLAGGPGDDLLIGQRGNDVFDYASGDGDDRIEALEGGANEVRLLDYLPEDVVLAVRAGPTSDDFTIGFATNGDRLVLVGALGSGNAGSTTLQVRFADDTVWGRAEMRARALQDIETGFDDSIFGFDGDDLIDFGAGDDWADGRGGADGYTFSVGDGQDRIKDSGTATTDLDVVSFVGFDPAQATVSRLFRGSETVLIEFVDQPGDSLMVIDALSSGGTSVEEYRFDDGTSWTRADLLTLLDNNAPVANDDGYFSVVTGQELAISLNDLLANDFDADDDALTVTLVDGSPDGTATLVGDGTLRFTSVTDFTGTTTIRYRITDGRNAFDEAVINVNVRPVAEALDDTGFTVDEDDYLVIRAERLLSNDVDGDRMIVGQVLDAVGGTVALTTDGNIGFTPDADYNGPAQFTYAANTPEGGRAEAIVHIDVLPVNDDPTGVNDGGFTVDENASTLIDPAALLANDSDIDGDTLVLQSVQSSADLLVTINGDGQIVVTPRADFFGTASFGYTVADPSGATDTATVTVTVTPGNSDPEAVDDRFVTEDIGDPIREDNPVVISLSRLIANDSDPDGDTLTLVSVSGASNGRATLLDNQTVLFEPTANFNGEAAFTYTISDGQGGTASATATLVYQPVNDRPVARDDHYSDSELPILRGTEDVVMTIPIAELLKNDYDVEGFSVTFENATGGVNGDVVVDGDNVVFTPDADFWGEATFGYSITDPEGLVDGGLVTMYFEAVGDAPPEPESDQILIPEDIPTVIRLDTLLGNDFDIDGDTLEIIGWRPLNGLGDVFTFGAAAAGPMNGTIEVNADGDYLFTPFIDATFSSGFVYIVSDNAEGTAEAFVDIVILPSNDDPTVVDDPGFVTPLDVPLVIRAADLLFNDYDIEQADTDGDGTIDVDLDNPDRPRPTFVGVDAVLDPVELAQGRRVPLGTFEEVTFRGEEFVVARFDAGYSGPVVIEYRIADEEGLEDTGFATATVADFYGQELGGTPLVDYIEGNALDETIRGYRLDDWVRALGGDDVIETGTGDDLIEAGAGNDWIDAGDGGDDIRGGAGQDTVSFAGSNVGVRADLSTLIGQGGYAQGDLYSGIEALDGTGWNDTLGGDDGANTLWGRDGDDLLEGRGDADSLYGGLGDDTLDGGAGGDSLGGGEGIDTATYFFSDAGVQVSLSAGTATGGWATGDTLVSIENLDGSEFADTLEGDGGANALYGDRGDDTLTGLAGDDRLQGGRGADRIDGGAGIDTAVYTLSSAGIVIDLAAGTASGGDAMGDVLVGIEIIEASYHDDALLGDSGDNRFRGSRGADLMDGRGGFDTADYANADEAVAVNLATGMGLAGEASGDTLISIEALIGSVHADTFTGSDGADVLDGRFGDDLLRGGFGSDDYLFGFDGSADRIEEQGDAIDIDRLVIDSALAPKDLSLLRIGDDLFVELERGDGYLIDTVTVAGHFLGTETGIEEIVFADGTTWDRAEMAARLRDGRFNAQDDIFRLGIEDEIAVIDPATLVLNDAESGTDALELVSVQAAQFGSVWINGDGMIEFLGDQDHNGDAFFAYTVRDALGRESTARVEVNLMPVNDAPVAVDDPLQYGVEDQPLRIRIETLLANDYDVDGDAAMEGLRIVSAQPLTGSDGSPLRPYKHPDYDGEATDATWSKDGQYIEFLSRPDYFGFAGFTYVLEDNDGAQSTADVEIYFAPVNDAPRITERAVSSKLEETTIFTVSQMMAKVYDVEGDAFEFVGLHIGADGNASANGIEVFDPDTGIIAFTPEALGAASISFDVIDARGAEAVLAFNINVRPQNLGPNARDDYGLRALEDEVILIDPALLLANDTDPDDDPISFVEVYRFAENGKVIVNGDGMIEFAVKSDFNGTASFEYTITDGRGGYDSATAHITVLPVNNGPELRNDVVFGIEDGPQYVIPAEAFGNDRDLDGDVIFFDGTNVLGTLQNRYLASDFTIEAKAANNTELPDWLSFDLDTLTFSGVFPEGGDPVEVAVFVSDPSNGAVHPFRFTFSESRATDLAAGLSVEEAVLGGFELRDAFAVTLDADGDGVASFDISAGAFDATVIGGRPLPSWLRFDADTRSFALTAFEADDPDLVRVQVVYTPDPKPDLPEDQYYSTERGFTLEFVLDPAAPDLAAINALLAGDPGLEAAGLFGLDLNDAASLTALRESQAPLDSWLTFDPETLSFTGTPPSHYVGAVPVRIDVAAGGGLPDMSIITEVVVDEIIQVHSDTAGFQAIDVPNRIDVVTPDDFNGSVVFTYDANDEKGGTSDEPAIIVFNVTPEREAPVANGDRVDLFENGSVTFAVADLLANDRDDDGDALRVTGFGDPANGAISVLEAQVAAVPLISLTPLPGGSWTAELEDGSPLPDWMRVDAATGHLGASVPLDVRADYAIRFINTDGTTTNSAVESLAFDGNDGAMVTYLPLTGFAGEDVLSYTLTDDAEGPVEGIVTLDVASLLDPPVAVTDKLNVYEDGTLVIDPATLLANDYDVDGDSIRFIGVEGAENGSVSFDGTQITFTPTPDFAGKAQFLYRVTDDTHGESTGLVDLTVISTNVAPEAVTDVFATVEDVPFEFTIADLLANDTDLDGDAISFVSLQSSANGGRIIELPDGRYQFVPDENVNGPLNFSYQITDGRLRDTGTITFDIEAVNDAPIGNTDGHFIGQQDQPFVIDFADLLFNDRDVEGDAFSIVEVFDGDNGTVWRDGDTAVFQGRAGYFGDGGFHYRLTDEHGATSTGYATVLVLPLFDVPVAVSDSGFEMLEDSFIDIDPAVLMANDDIPLGSEVTFLGLTGPGVEELESGLWRVTAAPDFFGTLTLRYALTNETGFEVPTTVRIEVLPLSDAPVAVDDSFAMTEDVPLVLFTTALTGNDYDVDRQAVTLTRVLDAEHVGVALTGDGQVIVTPDADFAGAAWFEYELTDSTGIATTGRVDLAIAAVNDAPVIAAPGLLSGVEDTALAITLPAGTFSDADGDALVRELRGAGGTTLPEWLTFDPETLAVSGTPPQDFFGDIALELAAYDGRLETVEGVVLRIAPVNDAPVIAETASVAVAENSVSAVTVAGMDVDGDTLAYAIAGGADRALFAINAATGALVFVNAPDFEAPRDADGDNVYGVTVSVSDGFETVTQDLSVTVTDVAEAVTITGTAGADLIGPRGVPDGQPEVTDLGDTLYGLDGDDTLSGGRGGDEMHGGAGDDIYRVTDAGEVVVELADEGFDVMRGWRSDILLSDHVERGVLGGSLGLSVLGNDGDNALKGNDGANLMQGEAGDDRAFGNGGNDTILGGAGNDTLGGGDGDDSIGTGDGDDLAWGGAGNDTLFGAGGNDVIYGGGGQNRIYGGAGSDTIYGTHGADTISGGADADTFRFNAAVLAEDTVHGNTITDFSQAEGDVILLNAGADTFAFVGSAGFSGSGPELRFEIDGTDTLVLGDLDGDGVTDFRLVLTGTLALSAGDFGL